MRKFWGFYDNGKYRVGCNGNTVYVYDQNNKELGKFNDIKYAYEGTFKPNTNIFVVKSTEGSLAIYNLDNMELLKKIVITRIGGQDEGFAFSQDGEFFYNIEKPFHTTETQMTVYRASDFEISKVLFSENKDMVIIDLEFDEDTGGLYILGFMRDARGVMDYGFVGTIINEEIHNIKRLDSKAYEYIRAYKDWERTGYTEKKLEWSPIKNNAEKPHVSLKGVYSEEKGSVIS